MEPIANQQVSAAETERMMKVQEVILKAMAGSLKWSDAAEIIGISDRSLRRWRERYEEHGYEGLCGAIFIAISMVPYSAVRISLVKRGIRKLAGWRPQKH